MQIRELNGLGLMHAMLQKGLLGDIDMLIAATEAVWKAIKTNPENVDWYVSVDAHTILFTFR